MKLFSLGDGGEGKKVSMVGRTGLEPVTTAVSAAIRAVPHQIIMPPSPLQVPPAIRTVLDEFAKFCFVDLRLSKPSVDRHRSFLKKVLVQFGPEPTTAQIRSLLATVENPYTYNNYIKSLRIYFRDYLDRFGVVKTFKFAIEEPAPPRLFKKGELRAFFDGIDTPKERAIFLMYATSGRRRGEILSLLKEQIDLEQRVIVPNKQSRTKHTWYSFFNDEAKETLEEYLGCARIRGTKLFPMGGGDAHTLFYMARHKTGITITPQDLRFWFANEMSRLGVADRFIDAFQGRVPRSVLARHYTDYSPENLKAVYDKAQINVLR